MSTEKKSLSPCYEAHITLAQDNRVAAQQFADKSGWVFSEITGCPILGQGTYCYLTGYDPDPNTLLGELEALQRDLLRASVPVLRAKIEHIVYDTKTGRNELAEVA